MQKQYNFMPQHFYTKVVLKTQAQTSFNNSQELNNKDNVPKKKSRRDSLGIFKNNLKITDNFDDEL